MNEAELTNRSPNDRILVLAAQGFALGLTAAWIMIPASAIFLVAYGSDALPVTYIGAAAAGVVSSSLLAAAFRRRPLAWVATRVLVGLSIALVASWVALATSNASWVAFGLLVLLPIVVPIGFVFVVGQAGMLLDVRVLKALYARVVAGFALGFVAGGIAGPPLLALVGSTENMLAAAATATMLFLALVAVARRRYPAELSLVEQPGADGERPTLRALLRNRYVVLIVAFQMLSAIESQWLDFLVFERAATRYAESAELARFISRFSAIAFGTDIVFLLVFAGWLLRHFGLRYGLTANAVGVLAVLAAIIVASLTVGSGTTIVFVLIVAARVTDLTCSDGTSRTSLSAAYQAVPTRLRAVSQAMVEGLAVPVAIGASGVLLLVAESIGDTNGLVLPVMTAVVVVAWTVVAMVLYREYGESLLANLRGRTLDPVDLAADGESNMAVIDRLIESNDERDVRLGLDILAIAGHPELSDRLQELVADARVNVRADALERLTRVNPELAVSAARAGLDDPSPILRAASVRVLGEARGAVDVARIAALADDRAVEVQLAVAFALSRADDATLRTRVVDEIARLARSELAHDRAIAALMLIEVEPPNSVDRAALRALLADSDDAVVNAALSGAGRHDAELLADIAAHLESRTVARAAASAMIRIGEPALAFVDIGLRRSDVGRRVQELLVRVARDIGGAPSIAMLRSHIDHPDRDVGLAVMSALGALRVSDPSSWATTERERDRELVSAVVQSDLEHAARALRALVACPHESSSALLRSTLRKEVDVAGRRVLAALAMRHDIDGLNRVVYQLAQRDSKSHALALEWLDVTLTGTDRAVVALLEPGSSDRERLHALQRWFPAVALDRRDVLLDVVEDREHHWRRPWIKACALYAGAHSDVDHGLIDAAEQSSGSHHAGERNILHETLAGIRHRMAVGPPGQSHSRS